MSLFTYHILIPGENGVCVLTYMSFSLYLMSSLQFVAAVNELYCSNTHIYSFLSVSDQQVAQDAGFIEISQADHVLDAVDGGGMHRLDVGGILGGDPVLLDQDEDMKHIGH